MLTLARRRRWMLWALLCAVAMSAMAPGIARALAAWSGDGAPWQVVCVSPATGKSGTPADELATDGMASCPYCLLRADLAAPPPALPAMLLPPLLAQAVPVLFLQAPRPLFAWHSAQPRAPPLLA